MRGIVFGKNIGARNIFLEKYGGAKHFLEKLGGGAKFFLAFLKTHPTGYPELKKTNPLTTHILRTGANILTRLF